MSVPAPVTRSPADSRFVLIEDDTLLRELMTRALQAKFSPRALVAFSDAPAGLAHCLAEPPELLITDLRLPGMDGRDVIRRLRARNVPTRFIVLTSNVTPALPAELIALGVGGFIDKSSPLDHAERAVERVLAGGLYFSASVGPSPSPFLTAADDQAGPPATILSTEETEIARLVAAGLFSKEIGDRLNLSPRTVERKRVQIMEKLGVRDLPGLVRWCVRRGVE